MMMTFAGFPMSGAQFLRELAQNNNKEWFEGNKTRYLQEVQAPALELVTALGERLQTQFPEIRYDTRTNGSGSLMRIYRDVRFSPDKSPYKTNVAMMFGAGTNKKMEGPGFGVQITPEQVEMMAGVFTFSKEMLARYREYVQIDKYGAALDASAAQVRAAGAYTIDGATYKRVPTGLPADHPRAQWLKHTGLHVYAPPITMNVAATPALVDAVMTHFIAMSPIYVWLREMMG
ncbi:MAG: DUF2461 domain-containing protein [Chloroflexota bacterium]|nr:DUF2461 domain-containing protein [Chloroflexota bacterium]